jgi:hypothetical protein
MQAQPGRSSGCSLRCALRGPTRILVVWELGVGVQLKALESEPAHWYLVDRNTGVYRTIQDSVTSPATQGTQRNCALTTLVGRVHRLSRQCKALSVTVSSLLSVSTATSWPSCFTSPRRCWEMGYRHKGTSKEDANAADLQSSAVRYLAHIPCTRQAYPVSGILRLRLTQCRQAR